MERRNRSARQNSLVAKMLIVFRIFATGTLSDVPGPRVALDSTSQLDCQFTSSGIRLTEPRIGLDRPVKRERLLRHRGRRAGAEFRV